MTPSKSENRQYLGPEVTSSHEKLFSVFLDQFYTIPVNFMKIRPGVLEKSSKIKKNNNKEKETEE